MLFSCVALIGHLICDNDFINRLLSFLVLTNIIIFDTIYLY